jgi:hypothetical protein
MLRAHVVDADRSWEVRILGSAWATFTLQADAIEFAEGILRDEGGGELIVHDENQAAMTTQVRTAPRTRRD